MNNSALIILIGGGSAIAILGIGLGIRWRVAQLKKIAQKNGFLFSSNPSKEETKGLPDQFKNKSSIKNLMTLNGVNGVKIKIYDYTYSYQNSNDYRTYTRVCLSSPFLDVGTFIMNPKHEILALNLISKFLSRQKPLPIKTGIKELDENRYITGSPNLKNFATNQVLQLLMDHPNVVIEGRHQLLLIRTSFSKQFMDGQCPSEVESLTNFSIKLSQILPSS